jgi:uncharacterized protein (DUF2147 family)
MRINIISFVFFLSTTLLFSMHPRATHSVEGTWLTAEGTSKITVAPCGSKFCGKLTWLKNPEKAPQTGKLGAVIFKDFEIADNNTLEEGKIYDPRNEKWYSGRLKVGSDGKLEVRGWLGVPALGKSVYWTRAN